MQISKTPHQAHRHETMAGILILLSLAVIGVLIFFQQFSYDEKIFSSRIIQHDAGVNAPEGLAPSLELEVLAPNPFISMSDPETFDPGALSDKIDGKADTYLEAGFVQLTTGRFVNPSDPDMWFEFFVYDMGRSRNAFSVYSTQRRKDVIPSDVSRFSYATENAVFFAHGPFYIEIIAARADPDVMRAMISMSVNFINRFPAERIDLPELNFLPTEHLDINSVSMMVKNGFGFERFDTLFTGVYDVNGLPITAFVSLRNSDEQAAALVKAYQEFLSDLVGGEVLTPRTGDVPGLVIVDVFGEYELFFSAGNVLAGIHAAADPLEGEAVAAKLYQKINETRQ